MAMALPLSLSLARTLHVLMLLLGADHPDLKQISSHTARPTPDDAPAAG